MIQEKTNKKKKKKQEGEKRSKKRKKKLYRDQLYGQSFIKQQSREPLEIDTHKISTSSQWAKNESRTKAAAASNPQLYYTTQSAKWRAFINAQMNWANNNSSPHRWTMTKAKVRKSNF